MTDELENFADLVEDVEESVPPIETTFASEPMFASLLRQAIVQLWPDDPVMADFVDHVVQPLSDLLGNASAKGGKFAEDMRALGKDVSRYEFDQSMRGHLINGLFPVLHVAKTLQAWDMNQFRYYDDTTRRLFIAGYILHDWLKFPGVEEELIRAGFSHNDSIGPAQLPAVETIFTTWCNQLGLDTFLASLGGPSNLLHDLIYLACNTQIRWGTLRNLSLLPRLQPQYSQKRTLCELLSRLADYLVYIARNPRDVAADTSIRTVISQLSNRNAFFTYHHLADNRGLLSNFIQQSCLEALQNEARVPILYAPSGVVYLTKKGTGDLPTLDTIAGAVIDQIKQRVRSRLQQQQSGFKRDGKGLKFAHYYQDFFDLPAMLHLSAKATFGIIHEGKKPSAGKRFDKMKDWLVTDLDLPDEVRVDQLAEWCFLAEKMVADEHKKFDTAEVLLAEMELGHLRPDFEAIPRDNRAGGVGYHWYFVAGHYLKGPGRGMDPLMWREQVETLAGKLVASLPERQPPTAVPVDEWSDLRAYIAQILTLGEAKSHFPPELFSQELYRYQNAKRKGRGTTSVCSLCSSAFEITKQQEAAVLFAPQVYSNKLPLHGSMAIRDICAICGLEMMLRQLLMNPGKASGGNFEGQRIRYLYFYPTYFFTPETLRIIKQIYETLTKPSFTELRKHLVEGQGLESSVRLDPVILQRLGPFLIPHDQRQSRDIRFSENEPVTFYFLGVQPPGRDAKEAEAWIHPAFFALLLPLCLDVKVVASEASLPLLLEADELKETVFLDGPHAFVGHLLRKERLNIDEILPALQRLAVAYLIHMDAHSGMGRTGFDYRWQDMPVVARNLATSPLYIFHYLKKWHRKQSIDTLPAGKVHLYLEYFKHFDKGGETMNHARQLTSLYRQFYRAKNNDSTSNIIRPLTIATQAILTADPRLFGDEQALTDMVFGTLRRRITKLWDDKLAFPPPKDDRPDDFDFEAAMRKFAHYLVHEVYLGALKGDASALRGKQLNLLANACEAIYREEQARYWVKRNQTTQSTVQE